MALPSQARPVVARRILQEASLAHHQFRMTGCPHPDHGDGSLMTRCLALTPAAEPLGEDRAFLEAVVTAALALLHHSGS